MSNIYENAKGVCTGCGACVAVCNSKAVEMIYDKDGFRIPQILSEKCVNCGLCKSVCVKFEEKERYKLSKTNIKCAYSIDASVRMRSSSGGIGYELAKAGIKEEFEVWGCVFDYESQSAKHVPAHTLGEIVAFQGSKYLHSSLVDFYKELIYGKRKKLMLLALPCQVRAARNIIDNLKIEKDIILVDLFCKGVPSKKMWEKYSDYIKSDNDITCIETVKFRDKEYGWHKCQMSISGEGRKYTKPASKDYFYKLYTSGLCFRDSCYNCDLKLNHSYSDIRIGDYWGKRFEENEEGVSLVVINSIRGKMFWERCVENNVFAEDVEFSEVVEAQGRINNKYSAKVKKMRKVVGRYDIDVVIKKMCRLPLINQLYNKLPESLKNMYRRIKRGYVSAK